MTGILIRDSEEIGFLGGLRFAHQQYFGDIATLRGEGLCSISPSWIIAKEMAVLLHRGPTPSSINYDVVDILFFEYGNHLRAIERASSSTPLCIIKAPQQDCCGNNNLISFCRQDPAE